MCAMNGVMGGKHGMELSARSDTIPQNKRNFLQVTLSSTVLYQSTTLYRVLDLTRQFMLLFCQPHRQTILNTCSSIIGPESCNRTHCLIKQFSLDAKLVNFLVKAMQVLCRA